MICGVDHDDLKQLFHVSKTVRDAVSTQRINFNFLSPFPRPHIHFEFRSNAEFSLNQFLPLQTLIAKQFHFAYSTPSKTRAFRNSIESLNNPSNFDMDFEAPNAPKQSRRRNRPQISGKKLEDISIALFADDDDDHSQRRPRRSLFMETEI